MPPDRSRSGPHAHAQPTGEQNARGVSDAYQLTDLLFDLLDSVLTQLTDLQAQVDALKKPPQGAPCTPTR